MFGHLSPSSKRGGEFKHLRKHFIASFVCIWDGEDNIIMDAVFPVSKISEAVLIR